MEEEHQHGHYGGISSTNTTPAMADLRQFFSPIPTHHFPAPGHHLFSSGLPAGHHYDNMMLVMGAGHHGLAGIHDFRSDNSAAMLPASSTAVGFEMENASTAAAGGFAGGDGGATARWPRQETLTLLEIRSRLDHKFKEANHKGPLWDELSRIMSEEHGYQRSGKKCREKFENLYKYYKKTKEGKAGRQDGKHYRFFRQLEALYGGESSQQQQQPNPNSCDDLNILSNSNNNTSGATAGFLGFHNTLMNHQSISLSNSSSELDTSSCEGGGDSSMDMMTMRGRKRRGGGPKRSWKGKIKEFVDSQMRRIMERQEAWLEKMMNTIEDKEKERMSREEEWRKRETERIDREHKLWAKERAWIEARDKALMDALHRLTSHEGGKEVVVEEGKDNEDIEMMKLLEVRGSMQARFDECGDGLEDENEIWKEISVRMGSLGHNTSPNSCKQKYWDFVNKKSHHLTQQQQQQQPIGSNVYSYGEILNGHGGMRLGPPHPHIANPITDSCFRILLGDGGETNPWAQTYNKGHQTH